LASTFRIILMHLQTLYYLPIEHIGRYGRCVLYTYIW
jgi:hypothetical protein